MRYSELELARNSFRARLQASASQAADVDYELPAAPPSGSDILVMNASGQILYLGPQPANQVLAGPTGGGNAVAGFRALAFADLAALIGHAANTIAAGDDSRFHNQNTDTGTTQATFALDSGAGGPLLKNSAGVLEVRNAADNAYADLRGGVATFDQIIVQTLIQQTGYEALIGDLLMTLAKDRTTGTPAGDAGLEILRGSQPAARSIFNETLDRWEHGLAGAMQPTGTVRKHAEEILAGALTGTVATITHNLGTQDVLIAVYDAGGEQVGVRRAQPTTDNAVEIDVGNLTVPATAPGFRVVVTG